MKRRELILIGCMILCGAILYVGVCKLMGYPVLASPNTILVSNQIATGHEGEKLPSIDILLPDSSTHFNIGNTQTDRRVVLFSFGPDCPYCHQQIIDIIHNIKHLNGVEFYLITSFPFKDMKRFYEQFHLDLYPNIVVGIDFNYSFMKYFKTTSIPYLAVYDEHQMLRSAYVGVVPSEHFEELN